MSKPQLYVFAVSHYCEKARWALDYLGIDYELEFLAPGAHSKLAKELGLRRSSVPFIVADGRALQGSADIVSWAEALAGPRRLSPPAARDECLAIEQRLDDVMGVHVRRYFYSEAVVEQPKKLRPIFTAYLPAMQKLGIIASWGLIRKLMIRGMDLGPAQGLESRSIVEDELRWLDGLLSDGRKFLVGGEFSRADIAAASLLAPLVLPEQHPAYGRLALPPRLSADVAGWSERPSFAWTRNMYAQHR